MSSIIGNEKVQLQMNCLGINNSIVWIQFMYWLGSRVLKRKRACLFIGCAWLCRCSLGAVTLNGEGYWCCICRKLACFMFQQIWMNIQSLQNMKVLLLIPVKVTSFHIKNNIRKILFVFAGQIETKFCCYVGCSSRLKILAGKIMCFSRKDNVKWLCKSSSA